MLKKNNKIKYKKSRFTIFSCIIITNECITLSFISYNTMNVSLLCYCIYRTRQVNIIKNTTLGNNNNINIESSECSEEIYTWRETFHLHVYFLYEYKLFFCLDRVIVTRLDAQVFICYFMYWKTPKLNYLCFYIGNLTFVLKLGFMNKKW